MSDATRSPSAATDCLPGRRTAANRRKRRPGLLRLPAALPPAGRVRTQGPRNRLLGMARAKRMAERGKDPMPIVFAIARNCARAVSNHRRLHGKTVDRKPCECIFHRADRGLAGKSSLNQGTAGENAEIKEALIDNRQSPVPEQVCFRIDFPVWRQLYPDRHRSIQTAMMLGHKTQEVAQRFGLTEGRISQLRREYHADWHASTENPCRLQTRTVALAPGLCGRGLFRLPTARNRPPAPRGIRLLPDPAGSFRPGPRNDGRSLAKAGKAT